MTHRSWLALAFAALLTATGAGVGVTSAATQPAAGATSDTTQAAEDDAFVIDLREDGSARVTMTVAFDLTTDAEREAFERLRDTETVRTRTRDRFAARMRSTANATANRTDREMAVTDPAISFETADGGQTGIVALSVTWDGLAAADGDDLVVTAPFANGFDADRALIVRSPDDYRLTAVSPSPNTASETFARWAANESLGGFRVVASPAPETPAREPTADATEDDSTPDATSALRPPALAAAVTFALTLVLAIAIRLRT